ncbi:phasin family protein [Fervidibacillus halotolerans]|uniref:Polyhydroxyalkanoate synthesis regulator n=1 Tax=Fervidibacillus halotolerans TaxID=2980027 RepID=A0A9E8RY59_9BACI|nr:hypothetical protein [Fervidibacillus halotolerans]WAA13470.1 hypothetical protein OE105_04990 [Fervidibacillus halotolerans]
MKDAVSSLLYLGLGIAAKGKEQMENTLQNLVEKGKITSQQSSDILKEFVKKGKESSEQFENMTKERLQELFHELNLVTKDEYDELKNRILRLEKLLEEKEKDNLK